MAQNDDNRRAALVDALKRVVGMSSPNSAVSQAGNMDAYRQHVIEAQTNGQTPMTFEQFQQAQHGS